MKKIRKELIASGEYLGFCLQKGFIYGLNRGVNADGRIRRFIYAVKGSRIVELYEYPLPKQEDDE